MHPRGRDFITADYLRKDMMKQAEKELLIRIAQNNASYKSEEENLDSQATILAPAFHL